MPTLRRPKPAATPARLEKRRFMQTLDEAATFREWIMQSYGEDVIADVAALADVSDPDELKSAMSGSLPLGYFWQYREVYTSFTKEVWSVAAVLAEEYGYSTPLMMLVELGDHRVIQSHEDFVKTMVTRAMSLEASDILESDDNG